MKTQKPAAGCLSQPRYKKTTRWLVGHKQGDLVKMQSLVNAEPLDALAMIVHRARAKMRGRGPVGLN